MTPSFVTHNGQRYFVVCASRSITNGSREYLIKNEAGVFITTASKCEPVSEGLW